MTIITHRLSVLMFVSFRLSVKNKKRNSAFDFVRFSISKSSYVVFFRFFLMSSFFRLFLMSFFFSTFSTLFNVESVFSARFFFSSSNSYRDSCFVRRFRFLSKVFQKKFHISFYFSINLKKNVKYSSNFWKIRIRQRKLLKFFQLWYKSEKNFVFIRFVVSHRDWKLLCVFCVKHDSICREDYRKICERCEISHTSCKSIYVRICNDFSFVNDS